MKKSFITSLILILSISTSNAIDVGGIISSDTTWADTTEPYIISSPIQIAHGSTLTIEAGVNVQGSEIRVLGSLLVNGTELSKVHFKDVHITPTPYVNSSSTFNISISHANIVGGSLFNPATGYGNRGSLTLEDSYIEDIPYMYIYNPEADTFIRRNVFNDFGGIEVLCREATILIENNYFNNLVPPYSGFCMINSWSTSGTGALIVRYNSFKQYQNPTVRNKYSGGGMDARHNYWNTTVDSEIQQMIHDGNDDISLGYIEYLPFLLEHHPDTPTFDAIIRVEHPVGTNLINNAPPLGFEACIANSNSNSRVFTIRNAGDIKELSSLSLDLTGPHATDFEISSLSSTTLIAGESMPFTVTFSPKTGGQRTAVLNIASSDEDQSPFIINLTGYALSQALDFDGDGLNDLAEFLMSDLGFDWEIAQPHLVRVLTNNIHTAGFVNTNNVIAVATSSTLVPYNPSTGGFTLSIGVETSDSLTSDFDDVLLAEDQVSINEGKVNIDLQSTNNSAFFIVTPK